MRGTINLAPASLRPAVHIQKKSTQLFVHGVVICVLYANEMSQRACACRALSIRPTESFLRLYVLITSFLSPFLRSFVRRTERNHCVGAGWSEGALYVFFALVGWRAAYSRNSTLAKVFLLSFPSAFAVNVVCAFLSPNEFSPVGMFLDGLILAYFFKVRYAVASRKTPSHNGR